MPLEIQVNKIVRSDEYTRRVKRIRDMKSLTFCSEPFAQLEQMALAAEQERANLQTSSSVEKSSALRALYHFAERSATDYFSAEPITWFDTLVHSQHHEVKYRCVSQFNETQEQFYSLILREPQRSWDPQELRISYALTQCALWTLRTTLYTGAVLLRGVYRLLKNTRR